MRKIIIASFIIALLSACQPSTQHSDSQAQAQNQNQADQAHTDTTTASQSSTSTDAIINDANLDAKSLDAQSQVYQAWVLTQIELLEQETQEFVQLLNDNQLAQAKATYPHVRKAFERSEPIASLFGELDARIDKREADLTAGETWTGFHAIEKILWTQNTTDGTQALGKQLLADIQALKAQILNTTIDTDLMIQGSVDLLNEISATKIKGEEEVFSRTDLYDIHANIDGAYQIYDILRPAIQAKDAQLAQNLEKKFDEVYASLDQHKISSQDYPYFDQLTHNDTKNIANAVNQLGELLAQMGIILS